MNDYKKKYKKYKNKYLELKYQIGGDANNTINIPEKLEPSFDSGEGDELVKRRLALIEILNFNGSNNQNFDIVRKIYDKNVVQKMSDGTQLNGIENVIKMMKEMYVTAPDIKVIEHTIQFGSGDWTAVGQVMEGTFTGPMTDPLTKKVYQPTGKKFKMYPCSLLKWNGDKIIEEHIFWDSGDWMKQLGISS